MADPTVRETIEQYQSRFHEVENDLRDAAAKAKDGLRFMAQGLSNHENHDKGFAFLLAAIECIVSAREELRNIRALRVQVRQPKRGDD